MKVCLVNTEKLKNKQEVIKESKYVLESFYLIKEWQIPILKERKLFLLDSGAFTFMNSYKGKVDWNDYIEKYANFINKHGIKYFFELDIDVLVGIEEVERLRILLEQKTNKKCIPVWHKSRGLDYWKKICKEYDYVAIGGIVTNEIKQKDYKYFTPLLKIARENNCKVHGLGFTRTKELKKYPFYSVDSCSWSGVIRFNNYSKFVNDRIKYLPKTNRVKKEKADDFFVYSFQEWIKFQKYADKHL